MTEDIRCPICARRAPDDGLVICRPCLGRIDDDLARIVELTTLAAGWVSANRQGSGAGGSRPVPGSRPPLDVAALDACLGHDVMPLLESWVRLIREEAGLTAYGRATEGRNVTVGLLVPWLRSWSLWAAERVGFPIEDYARELRDARWALERLDPDRDKPGPRIPCQADHPDADGRTCGYRLVVTMDRPADDVTCPRCGDTTTAGRILLSALNDPAVTVWAYPADITEALGIAARTLRDWGAKGEVRRMGSRYDVGACFRKNLA